MAHGPKTDELTRIAPPAATGNAGPRFEAKVGAFYLLAVLTAGEPRGLPGAVTRSCRPPLNALTTRCRSPPERSCLLRVVDCNTTGPRDLVEITSLSAPLGSGATLAPSNEFLSDHVIKHRVKHAK
jgi:hypothetical protein